MNVPSLTLTHPPEINDESIAEIIDFLYQLTTALENQYYGQLHRYYQSDEPTESDQLEDFNDPFPEF
jgi:hypothetical protein